MNSEPDFEGEPTKCSTNPQTESKRAETWSDHVMIHLAFTASDNLVFEASDIETHEMMARKVGFAGENILLSSLYVEQTVETAKP